MESQEDEARKTSRASNIEPEKKSSLEFSGSLKIEKKESGAGPDAVVSSPVEENLEKKESGAVPEAVVSSLVEDNLEKKEGGAVPDAVVSSPVEDNLETNSARASGGVDGVTDVSGSLHEDDDDDDERQSLNERSGGSTAEFEPKGRVSSVILFDEVEHAIWKANDDDASNEPLRLKIKFIVFGSRNLTGRGVYMKFYHGYKKFKTSKKWGSSNRIWNESFELDYVVGEDFPVIRVVMWGKCLLGNVRKGYFDLDLIPVLDGEIIDDYFRFSKRKAELRVRAYVIGPSVSEMLDAAELSPDQAYEIDRIKLLFPGACYSKIMEVYRNSDYSLHVAVQRLRKLGMEEITGRARTQNLVQGKLFSPEDRALCVKLISDLMPDVGNAEIQRVLSQKRYYLGPSIETLIANGRAMQTRKNAPEGPRYKIEEIKTGANFGGFVKKTDFKTGKTEVLHCSHLVGLRNQKSFL